MDRFDAAGNDRIVEIGKLFVHFPRIWWKAALFALVTGAATLLILSQVQNRYRATAIISPVAEDVQQPRSLALGALASVGLSLFGPTKVEDLEALFRSRDLAARVFRQYDIWHYVLDEQYDRNSRKIVPSLWDRISGHQKSARGPGDWDAIRATEKNLEIFPNKKAGTLVLSLESYSAEGSAKIVTCFLEEAKSRMQEEAFERARANKNFLRDQISKTVDPVSRERLYTLYGQEVEREMMAGNREQFGFKVVDHPRVPDRKAGPHRALITLLMMVGSFIIAAAILSVWKGTGPA